MCRVLQVARSGWYIWHQRRYQINRRQQFRFVCDNVVREAFSDANQRYGAPRLTNDLRALGLVYNIKTVVASLRQQGGGRKPRAGSARSVTVCMVCQYQRIC